MFQSITSTIVSIIFSTPTKGVFIIIISSSTLGELYTTIPMDDFKRETDEKYCEIDCEIMGETETMNNIMVHIAKIMMKDEKL